MFQQSTYIVVRLVTGQVFEHLGASLADFYSLVQFCEVCDELSSVPCSRDSASASVIAGSVSEDLEWAAAALIAIS